MQLYFLLFEKVYLKKVLIATLLNKFLKTRKMQVIKNNKSLAEAIAQLELQKQTEEELLKEHFLYTVDSLNPLNIIKENIYSLTALKVLVEPSS